MNDRGLGVETTGRSTRIARRIAIVAILLAVAAAGNAALFQMTEPDSVGQTTQATPQPVASLAPPVVQLAGGTEAVTTGTPKVVPSRQASSSRPARTTRPRSSATSPRPAATPRRSTPAPTAPAPANPTTTTSSSSSGDDDSDDRPSSGNRGKGNGGGDRDDDRDDEDD